MAKNLSDWAVKNKDCTVQPQLEKLIKAFHKAGKPLGMCCISPVLAAKLLPGCEVTVGQDKECDTYVAVSSSTGGCKQIRRSDSPSLCVRVQVAVRWDRWGCEGAGLQTRQHGCGQSPRGWQEQAGHHLRLHVQRSHSQNPRRNRRHGPRDTEAGFTD